MSLTCTSTPVSYNWKVKTCCFSKWHCKPTTRLPQMFSCRWIPAGPLRADTRMMQSKVSCFRMGLLKPFYSLQDWIFKALFDTLFYTRIKQPVVNLITSVQLTLIPSHVSGIKGDIALFPAVPLMRHSTGSLLMVLRRGADSLLRCSPCLRGCLSTFTVWPTYVDPMKTV